MADFIHNIAARICTTAQDVYHDEAQITAPCEKCLENVQQAFPEASCGPNCALGFILIHNAECRLDDIVWE